MRSDSKLSQRVDKHGVSIEQYLVSNQQLTNVHNHYNFQNFVAYNERENFERQAIEKALEATRWNKTAAAKRLGISFRALRYRLKKLGME